MGRICIYRRDNEWRYTIYVGRLCVRHGPLGIPSSAGQEQAMKAARGKYSGPARVIRVGDLRSFSESHRQAKRNGGGPDPAIH